MLDKIFSSLRISASGLSAQRRLMDVIANNIANANTLKTPEGTPYRRQQVLLQLGDLQLPGIEKKAGVKVAGVVEDTTPGRLVYDPGNPFANEDGYVQYPNVNIIREMVDMIQATRAYEANAAVIDATKAMVNDALKIGKV